MKKYPIGMYCIWPDHDYIERCIQAGVNTIGVVMTNFSLEEDISHDHYGHYFEVIEMLEKYSKDDRVDIVLIPTLNTCFADKPERMCFHDGEKYLRRTPCPLSKEWISSRLNIVAKLVSVYNVKSVMFDVEHYNWRTPAVEEIWDGKWKPDHKCHCPRCKDFTKKEQWKLHHKEFKTQLKKMNLDESGQLAYFNLWNFDKYTGKKWLWTEKTYPIHKKPSKSLFWKHHSSMWGRKFFARLLYGQKVHISAGLWIERFTANDFIDYIELMGKKSIYDGFWIYPQARLSKHTRFKRDTQEDRYKGKEYFGLIDDPHAEGSNVNFFLNLKEVIEEIKDYRKGWIFKLRNLIKL